ncbi:MAG TPA: hypothetical protein VIM31_00070 [Candidatus Microsaccharimonas sp.]|jgi:hypothetical protein
MKDSVADLLNTYEKWIIDDDLDKVVARIHFLYLHDSQAINGNILALFANRLINSEIEVGGPYLSKDDIYTNTLIMNLFRTIGTPLEKLEVYLSNKAFIPKNKEQRLALSLATQFRKKVTKDRNRNNNKSITMLKNNINEHNVDIRKQALLFLNKIIKVDTESEITLISSYIQQSLIDSSLQINNELCYNLGYANVAAWIAYTIYDDFIDEEGSPQMLSLANIMHRLSYREYIRLFPSQIELIDKHFDSSDNCNLWELKNCRATIDKRMIIINKIPKYGNGKFLANRSVGHVLGPKLLINSSKISKIQLQLINNAFDNYLIAKQITDDLTDWKSDLRKGHLSYVVSKLLLDGKIVQGEFNTETLITHFKNSLWNSVYEKCLREAMYKLAYAEKNLDDSKLFLSKNIFVLKVIHPLKEEVNSSLKKHLSEKQFLKTFNV